MMRTVGYSRSNAPSPATLLSGRGALAERPRPLPPALPPAFWLLQPPWTPRRARPLAKALPRPLPRPFWRPQ